MGLKPNNGLNDFFKNRKTLIIVPHQDDELFLCGTIMGLLKGRLQNIYVAFTTNGDYGCSFEKRKSECIKALSVFGIECANVVFLGYGDQYDTEYGHLYHAPCDSVINSKAGYTHTYGNESCKYKRGECLDYTLSNYSLDLEFLIKEIHPDIIFCNDLDWHPEHRLTSLVFDRVMGGLLKEQEWYRPLILKGFIYYFGWDGLDDYRKINNGRTKKPHRFLSADKRFEFGNPYFRWDERICLPIDYSLIRKKRNKLYKAIRKYRFSKNAMRFYGSMMNSDAVFWYRCSTNYAINALIETSSGQSEYLNDFVIVDSSDITRHNNMPYDKSIWRPDVSDIHPLISITFERVVSADSIVIYRDIDTYSRSSTGIEADVVYTQNGERRHLSYRGYIGKFDLVTRFNLDVTMSINRIVFHMDNNSVGLSEIEVIKNEVPSFVKIMVNGTYAYDYYIGRKCEEVIVELNTYRCEENRINKEVVRVVPDGEIVVWEGKRLLIGERVEKCYLRAEHKDQHDIFDAICISRKSFIDD